MQRILLCAVWALERVVTHAPNDRTNPPAPEPTSGAREPRWHPVGLSDLLDLRWPVP